AGLKEAATRIAERVGYSGVGTVEFLVSGSEYAFLEMNPRLQVEHGITEEITGIDLVQTQIRIARGESIAGMEIVEAGHAIEARVCAEDPEKGFLPAPGRIARFEPALGPRIRLDTGVASGSVVPAAFDSLVAKVIASGSTREEARARLVSALADFDLVIEDGATNKGYIAEILDHADYRRGAVDTTWLDRFGEAREPDVGWAAPALIAAAILAYQRNRAATRLNFFAESSNIARVAASQGEAIDLSFQGEQYRLEVFAIGSWRYRVHLDDRVIAATLREEGAHTARLELGDRTLRVLYDVSDIAMRVEVEGHAYAFSSQTAGQVRAGAPAMVVAVQVEVGDVVQGGQPLGVLEAMKMEVGFDAPVSGTVTEVRVRKGEQVAAGDVILVIDPQGDGDEAPSAARITLEAQRDPLEPLFAPMQGTPLGIPDLAAADRAPLVERRGAIAAAREETRRVLLGYDANAARAGHLADFLEAGVPEEVSDAFCWELAEIRSEVAALADVAQLFIRSPAASISGEHGPSNEARLRMYARRVRAGGAGLDEEFLGLIEAALSHYGIHSIEPSDALERAVLRLLATQRQPELRDRLAIAMLRRLIALARRGVHMSGDAGLTRSLDQISGMRGLVSHRVADAAIEARYEIFERPEIETQAERTTKEVQAWLDLAATQPTAPPERVLRDLADARRVVFDRVGSWISDDDPRRRAIALAAQLRRQFSPEVPVEQSTVRVDEFWLERMELRGGRVVIGAACDGDQIAVAAGHLLAEAGRAREQHEWPSVHALELFATAPADPELDVAEVLGPVLEQGLPAGRLTVTIVRPLGPDTHRTFLPTSTGYREDEELHGLHPEAARRVDLERLGGFDLERLIASEGVYAF
ncbi:MAG: biotin/lipoyl-containing protein, partial [Myxococcota bacterium]